MNKLFLAFMFLLLAAPAYAQTVRHDLTWTDTNTGTNQEDGTKIEQKINTGAYIQVGQVAVDVVRYSATVTNPAPGQHNICYRLKAFKGTLESVYSTEACVVTPIVTVVKLVPPGGVIIQQIILP